MDKHEVESLLRLQKSAYEFLLWLDKRAETQQELLSDDNLEKWRFAQSCETWVRSIHGMIPQAIRPAQNEIPAFSRLFSSFFQTSFYITENAPVRSYDYYGHANGFVGSGKRKLMAGSPRGKTSSRGKSKVADSTRMLRRAALEEIALENGLFPSQATIEQVEQNHNIDRALNLWTYVHELNRRANFASQGEAVRALWQSLDKSERETINVESVLAARDSLLWALKNSCG